MRWLLIGIAVFATPAFADYLDGNDLYKFLQTTKGSYEWGIGQGYAMGVQDAFNGGEQQYFCVPPPVNISQVEEIVFNYLKVRPEQRHLAAKILVLRALKEKFPCSRGANLK